MRECERFRIPEENREEKGIFTAFLHFYFLHHYNIILLRLFSTHSKAARSSQFTGSSRLLFETCPPWRRILSSQKLKDPTSN